MFSGIIEETGVVARVHHQKNLDTIFVRAKKILAGIKAGDSISVNGVCLTVVKKTKNVLVFDVMKETLRRTTLGRLAMGDVVNLERALKVNGRLDGHFVTGHIDDIAVLNKIIEKENYTEFHVGLPRGLRKYLVPKGSVCVDGVSLTVGEVQKGRFSVYLIPHTKKVTTFASKRQGDHLNIETDILAKYVLNK